MAAAPPTGSRRFHRAACASAACSASLMLAPAALAQLVEHAHLAVGLDHGLPPRFDFLGQPRRLLGQRAALGLQQQLIALRFEQPR